MAHNLEKKARDKISELINSETEDCGCWKLQDLKQEDEYEEGNDFIFFNAEMRNTYADKDKTICFRFDVESGNIEVELGEDSFNKIEDYEYTIKYFWMALLSWD